MSHRPEAASGEQAERLHRFAHDLKNRIGGLWEAMRLLNGPMDDDQREELKAFAERNFFNAQRDVEVLLDDLAVDRTPRLQPLERKDLRKLVEQAVEANAYRFQRKEQTCSVEGAGTELTCDGHMIIELLQALLSNASKFSPKGAAIQVRITADGAFAQVDVADPGAGLNAEDLPRLFDRYVILSSRSTDGEAQMRGTLSRARQWAQVHGGMLTASSDGPGKGSCFSLRLPLSGPSA